jgi:parallel beta-helix repeat protein
VLVTLGGCDQKKPAPSAESTAVEKSIQEKLVDAKPGDVIEIPAGTFSFARSLNLNTDGVTIRGKGMDKSVLSFKGAVAGAEGLLVHASNFTLEDVAIEDTKGDALKINGGENITLRRVRAEWTRGPATENGAYGLYPVQCRNVLIEGSVVIGASDAGIYVGQSENIVVRGSTARHNVAGIEIENSHNADVYDNLATENTGGILVFNMPNLQVPGWGTRVFRNKVLKNNLASFAAKGTAVASVPAGAGVVINSNKQVEIFDNDIADNQTANVIVSSYFSTGYATEQGIAAAFDPYPEKIFIYGNRFSGGGDAPDRLELKALKTVMFGLTGHIPDILWDGFVDPKKLVGGKLDPADGLCVDNGAAQVLDVDGPHQYANPVVGKAEYACTLPKLPAVAWAGLDEPAKGTN